MRSGATKHHGEVVGWHLHQPHELEAVADGGRQDVVHVRTPHSGLRCRSEASKASLLGALGASLRKKGP